MLAGLPRGLFPEVPALPHDTEAKAVVEPHGHLIEVGVDVARHVEQPSTQGSWPRSRPRQGVGYWAMTMKESQNGAGIVPPKFVFDPKVTPPSQCKRV